MAVYVIYKYSFVQSADNNVFAKETSDNLIDRAQQVFDDMLHGENPFPVRREKRDKTSIPLDNEIVVKNGRISLMLLCNEKHRKYEDKKNEKDLEYHPGCYVLFDNREGVANIAIERTSAFDNNTDKVSLLLQEAINNALFDKGINLAIEIKCKVKESSLWEIVNHQVNDYNDRVTKVVFEFPIPGKVGGVDASNEMKDKLAVMASVASAMNGAKASYHVEADKDKSLRLERTQEDLAQMVHLCSRNAYDIHVHFRYYGVYRFGYDEKALSSLNDGILDRFKNSQLAILPNGEMGLELVDWLDKVRNITEGFKDALPLAKKRKKGIKK